MSTLTYSPRESHTRRVRILLRESGGGLSKSLVVFVAIKTPPMGRDARRRAGFLLRLVQEGEKIGMPHSRPMPRVRAN